MQQRLYQGIWETLKEHKHLTLECFHKDVRRVKRGIFKEKDEDIGFKLIESETGKAWKITCTTRQAQDENKTRLTFVMELRNGCFI